MVTTSKDIENAVVSWVDGSFSDFIRPFVPANEIESYRNLHTLFVTVTLREQFAEGKSPVDSAFGAFRGLYLDLVEVLYGSNASRRMKEQPRCFAFYDYEGSRIGVSPSEASVTPHVHSLMIIHPKATTKWKQIGVDGLRTELNARRRANVKSFDLQLFDPNQSSFRDLVSYISKAYHKNYLKWPDVVSEFITIYPEGVKPTWMEIEASKKAEAQNRMRSTSVSVIASSRRS